MTGIMMSISTRPISVAPSSTRIASSPLSAETTSRLARSRSRYIGEHNALLLVSALTDETLADPKLAGEVLALLEAVARLVAQQRLPSIGGGQGVEDPVLCRQQRRQL